MIGKKQKEKQDNKKKEGLTSAQLVGSPGMWWFFTVVVAALTLLAYTTPLTTETPEPRPYTVQYDFDYTGEIPPNPVYQNNRLVYGQPLFLNIVSEITTSVTYSINNPNVRIDNGQLILKSVLIGSAGWDRVLATSEPVTFSDSTSASASLDVDFKEALAVGAEINAATGTSSTLNVRVIAETYVNGELLKNGKAPGGLDERTTADIVFNLKENSATVMLPPKAAPPSTSAPSGGVGGLVPGTAGASTETGSASTESGNASSETGSASSETGYLSGETGYLEFQTGSASTETGYLSGETGYLEFQTGSASTETGYLSAETGYLSSEPGSANTNTGSANSGGGAPAPRPTGGTDPSVKTITQMVPTDVNVPNKLSLGFIEFPVDTARTFLALLLGLCIALAAYNSIVMSKVKKQGVIARIIAEHGKRIIPMASFNASKVKDAVVLEDFVSLHAISLETEQLIMIKRHDDYAEFWVSDNGTVYTCTVQDEHPNDDNNTDDNNTDDNEEGVREEIIHEGTGERESSGEM
jgi:hypothetical protein